MEQIQDEACLGLLAVHNFYTPFLFFLRKTALRQVVHRDVTSPHFVRSSHLPKSAELAKAILTTINSAIKKEPIKGSLFMAGTTSGFADGRGVNIISLINNTTSLTTSG